MTAPMAKLRKYALAGGTALRNRWAYPADVWGLVLSYGLFVFVFSRLWVAAYAGKAVLAGYTQNQLTWYFLFAELALFSLGNASFANLAADIKSGQVAYTLGRPWAYPLACLSEALVTAVSLALPFAVVGAVIGWWNAGPWAPTSVAQVGAILLSLVLTLILQFLCQYALAMTAFWVEENAAFLWIHQKFALVVGTFLPLEFFPASWRPWAEATPYAWLAYPPSRMFAAWDAGQAPWLLGGQGLWVVAMGCVVALVYRAGRRRTVQQGG